MYILANNRVGQLSEFFFPQRAFLSHHRTYRSVYGGSKECKLHL